MACGRSDNPSKQDYNPVIHHQFRESNIQVVMLRTTEGPQGEANKVISSCFARKCEKLASS